MRAFLKLLGGVLAVALLLVAWIALTPLPLPENRFTTPGWIGPVHVVDVESGTVSRDRVLRIEGGRIAEILDAATLDPSVRPEGPPGAYVLPGLWDMHAILLRYSRALDHPAHLAHGVTRLRNILDCPAEGAVNLYPCMHDKRAWNEDVRAGRLAGPIVMESGSYPLNGPGRPHPDMHPVYSAADAEGARALVRHHMARPGRSDHLKSYDRLPRDAFLALVEEARALGSSVSGHVPHAVAVLEAARAGMRSIAHGRSLPVACSAEEPRIIELRLARAPQAEWMRAALDGHDPARCDATLRELAALGTYLSPTLVTRWNETRDGLAALGTAGAKSLTPPLIALLWQEDTAELDTRTAEEEALFRRFFEAAADRVREAEAAGVPLLLGTDTWEPGVLPGAGMHSEIGLWRDAGLPPAAILRAMTLTAARYHGLEATHGRVAPGHVADLVFTAGDPLRDLSVLATPAAVMQEGRLYDRAALDGLLAHAREVAGSWRLSVHILRDFTRNPRGFGN
ncbi:MAG TPA: amidohydrolase family protein [Azospirillaceae bacterium]|nr:amidohydrolase family protein [Azospirillaceae bacterium]